MYKEETAAYPGRATESGTGTEDACVGILQNRQEADAVMPDVPGEMAGPAGPKESEEEGELEPENPGNRPPKGVHR